jgi:iron complex transport system substrate-binding protein
MRRASPRFAIFSALLLTSFGFAGLVPPHAWRGVASAHAGAPERIVAVGGVITEILYALGEESRIVGVDTTSLFPQEALKQKPNVGYVRALSAEGVLSLKPTLVLATDSAGPPDAMKLVADSGVRMVQLPDDLTPNGVAARIRRIAALTGASEKGEKLAADVAAKFESLRAMRAHIATPRRVLFILSLQNGRIMAGGRNTSADAMIRFAGAVNAADAIDGYKPMTDEAVIAAAPDLILTMTRGDHASGADQAFALPSLGATPAAKTKAFAAMDGLYLLGFGPRTPDAARDLMQAVYGAAVVHP